MKAMLNPDQLTGKRVNHVVFGRGRILHVQDGYMHVSFGGVERMFEYPAAARPVRRKTEGFVRDEYDTVILADLVKCTV